jgi:hypothetical protein
MLHEEVDGIAAFAATETFVDLLAAGNGEGRGFFVVKRAKAEVIGAAFFQFHEGADDLDDVYPVEDLLYGVLRDQDAFVYMVCTKSYLRVTFCCNCKHTEKANIPKESSFLVPLR